MNIEIIEQRLAVVRLWDENRNTMTRDYTIVWDDTRSIVVHNCDNILHALARALEFGRTERVVSITEVTR